MGLAETLHEMHRIGPASLPANLVDKQARADQEALRALEAECGEGFVEGVLEPGLDAVEERLRLAARPLGRLAQRLHQMPGFPFDPESPLSSLRQGNGLLKWEGGRHESDGIDFSMPQFTLMVLIKKDSHVHNESKVSH